MKRKPEPTPAQSALQAALRMLSGDKNIDRNFRLGLERCPSNIAAIRKSDHDLDKLIELAGKAAAHGAWRNCQEFLAEANVRALVLIGGGK